MFILITYLLLFILNLLLTLIYDQIVFYLLALDSRKMVIPYEDIDEIRTKGLKIDKVNRL